MRCQFGAPALFHIVIAKLGSAGQNNEAFVRRTWKRQTNRLGRRSYLTGFPIWCSTTPISSSGMNGFSIYSCRVSGPVISDRYPEITIVLIPRSAARLATAKPSPPGSRQSAISNRKNSPRSVDALPAPCLQVRLCNLPRLGFRTSDPRSVVLGFESFRHHTVPFKGLPGAARPIKDSQLTFS